MAFDYIWDLEARAAGQDDTARQSVWVDLDRADAAVQPFVLQLSGATDIPVSSRVARLRWIPGISTRSQLIDREGNRWVVRDLREVGRRKWIDLSISTIDVQTGPDETTVTGEAPEGWRLFNASGDSVITIPGSLVDSEYTGVRTPCAPPDVDARLCAGVRVWLPDDDQFIGEWDPLASIPVEVGGVDCLLTFRRQTNPLSSYLSVPALASDADDLNDIDSATGSGVSVSQFFFDNQPNLMRRTRQRVWPFGSAGNLWAWLQTIEGLITWPESRIHGFTVRA